MTLSVIVMIVIGFILIFVSFFVSEKLSKKEENFNADLLTVKDDYEFSERELRIIKNKIEDVIADQAKEILYETNESLANMANEKTLALGDYAVTVCDEIERNHKEVMFLYSMLDDKQKEITKTVQSVDKVKQELNDSITKAKTENDEDGSLTDSNYEVNSQIIKLKAVERQQSAAKKAAVNSVECRQQEDSFEKDDTDKSSLKQNEKSAEFLEQSLSHKEKSDAIQVEKLLESESISFESEDEFDDFEDVFADVDQTDLEEEFKKDHNSNDIILEMYRNGSSIISIARELGIGVGEVKLVIDLYQGE